jgi:hypothetical protein
LAKLLKLLLLTIFLIHADTFCLIQSDSASCIKEDIERELASKTNDRPIRITSFIKYYSKAESGPRIITDSIIDTLSNKEYQTIISNIDSIGLHRYISGFDGYGVWGHILANNMDLYFGCDYYKMCGITNGHITCTIYFNKKAERIISKHIKSKRNQYLKRYKLEQI